MPKNIVVCCDGTGNEFGEANSNVVKLYSMLEDSPRQVTYYHPGLGTMGSRLTLTALGRWWTRVIGLAFGYGLMDNIADAYTFLMDRYDPDDNVYLFGFSRGAYTVRALAAMLHMFGLLKRGNYILIPYAQKQFRSRVRDRGSFDVAFHFRATFSHGCKPRFLGVWDTVSSVGWISDPLNLPYTFHNPDIAIGRHAISIDERRCAFRQNLWEADPKQDSKQVWFAGVHCDVGGGYAMAESGLANVALAWMLREATGAGLLIDQSKVTRVMGENVPDFRGKMHESLTGAWRILEWIPKRYTDMTCSPPRVRHWPPPRGRARFIQQSTVVHQSVLDRANSNLNYHPSNLPTQYAVER